MSFLNLGVPPKPQGSILCPLLFSIYINDLPNDMPTHLLALFTDDPALYCSMKSSTDLQQMLDEDLATINLPD